MAGKWNPTQDELAAMTLDALREKGWWNMITEGAKYRQVIEGYYGLSPAESMDVYTRFIRGEFDDVLARKRTEDIKRALEDVVAQATRDTSGGKGSVVLQAMSNRGFLDPGLDQTQSIVPMIGMPGKEPKAAPVLPPKIPVVGGDPIPTYLKWLTALRDTGSLNMGYAPLVHGNSDEAAAALARTYGLEDSAARTITRYWRQTAKGGGKSRRKRRRGRKTRRSTVARRSRYSKSSARSRGPRLQNTDRG